MPEEALATPPAPAAEAAPAAPQFDTMQAMMADLDAKTNPTAKPAPAPEATKEAASKVVPEKPEAKPTKPEDKVDEDEKFLKSSTKHWRIYEKKTGQLKEQFSKTENELKAKIKALEEKPKEQPGDAAKLAALEKQLEDERGQSKTWKERAAQADFTKSEAYDKQFRMPYQRELNTALDEIKQLRVKFAGADGEQSERQGTEADFKKAMALPPGEQDEFIHQTFGSAAWRVINRISELHRINRASVEATQEHAAKYDAEQQELQGKTKKEEEAYNNYFKSSLDGIKEHKELGKYFSGYDDDPEATALLNKTYEEVDNFAKNAATMTPDVRAAHAAVYRAMTAGFLPLLSQHKRALAQVDELKAELSKYRKTDPGQAPKGDGEPTDAKDSWGIAEASRAMDAMG